MLCENCQRSAATVHLTGWNTVRSAVRKEQHREPFEHHFCGTCADELKQSNHLLNPLLNAAPGAQTLKIKVLSVSPDLVEVRVLQDGNDFCQDHLAFLSSRLPAQYAIVG